MTNCGCDSKKDSKNTMEEQKKKDAMKKQPKQPSK